MPSSPNLYPLALHPIYKEMVWGGQRIASLFARPSLPFAHTGESWDISCRKNEMGIVSNGMYAGQTFIDVINLDRAAFLGGQIQHQKDFPLLVKLIDANDNLSVQVHPDNAYAHTAENDTGKTEMWYILDAPPDGFLIIGLNDGVTRDAFRRSIETGEAEKHLCRLPIKKGDVINIPAGLVHAITKGIVLAEVQQNSDITYRIYDYNRTGLDGRPRALHIEKSLDVIDFEGKIKKETTPGLAVSKEGNTMTYYIANPYFAVVKADIQSRYAEHSDLDRFFIYTCLEGDCRVQTENFSLDVKTGDSFFIPAALGDYEVTGSCSLLKSFVPDIEKDFTDVLLREGYSPEDIENHTAVAYV